jgi:hypothetical protein
LLNENPGVVQVIAKAAGCSWATVKYLLLMTAADRRLSRADLDQARENFERLEVRTAKRVLEFYDERRSSGTAASPSIVPGSPVHPSSQTGEDRAHGDAGDNSQVQKLAAAS